MYAILWWVREDYVVPILNKDKSMRLFTTLEEADNFANENSHSEDLRVISIEGVKE